MAANLNDPVDYAIRYIKSALVLLSADYSKHAMTAKGDLRSSLESLLKLQQKSPATDRG